MKMICIEGIDAVGKETVSKALEKTLADRGFRVKRIAFPIYEGDFGRCIKDVLMGACGDAPTLHPDLMSPLYTLDRIAYFKANAEDLITNYDYLICDRSFYSNFMYQASKMYMEHPELYHSEGIPFELYNWICKNFTWEFCDTRLYNCTDIQTFVLTLSEEDSLKQLGNRKEKDTNEKNRAYLSGCKKFITHMMSDSIRESANKIIEISENDEMDSLATQYMLHYYFNHVHLIEVIHADKAENIENATMQTVDKILKYLFECEDNVKTEITTNDTPKFNLNDYIDLCSHSTHYLINIYEYLLDAFRSRKGIRWVQLDITRSNEPSILFFVNADADTNDLVNSLLDRDPRISTLIVLYTAKIEKCLPEGFPYHLRIMYNGKNFTIHECSEDN